MTGDLKQQLREQLQDFQTLLTEAARRPGGAVKLFTAPR